MKFPLGCACTAALLGFIAASGCLAKVQRAATVPLASSAGARTLPKSAGFSVPSKLEATAPPMTPSGPAFDPDSVRFVLDDPRLGEVRKAYVTADYAEAAAKLEATPEPENSEDALRWSYQLGRLYAQAGDSAGALRAFDRAASGVWPLAPYAQLSAAQALLKAGQFEQALTLARAVGTDLPISGAARLLMGEALEAAHDSDGAIDTYLAYLGDNRHPLRWAEVCLRAADAMLAAKGAGARAEQAVALARRVIVEAPTGPWFTRALAIERRGFALIPETKRLRPLNPHGKNGTMTPADWSRDLSPADQLTRATALGEAHETTEAIKAIDALVASMRRRSDTAEVQCRAQLLRGQLLDKLRERAREADAYDKAITLCEAYPEALVEALYFGGKASASAGRCDEAMVRFERVEQDFHAHRFADDARLRGANCALERGDEARFQQMLASMPTDYPDGDTVADGLFTLALRRMGQKEWAQALEPLTQGESAERSEFPPGRFTYFRARALAQTGDLDGARRTYVSVIQRFPLSYYMLHAYRRLLELDRPAAAQALAASVSKEPAGSFFIADLDLFHEGAFARGIELMRQGENDSAKREFALLVKEDPKSETIYAIASMYARAGLVRESHYLVKSRASDWLQHYPVGAWRAPWELSYPRPFAKLVEREASESKIPAALGYAIMREESAFDPEAVSPAHAYGLMQLIVPTAKRLAKDLGLGLRGPELTTPDTNVKLGCRFLGELRTKFATNPHLAISAYNAGPGAPQRWLSNRTSNDFDIWVEQIPYLETRRYTKRVLTSFAAYSFLYDQSANLDSLALPTGIEAK